MLLLETEEIKHEHSTSLNQVLSHMYLSAQVKIEVPIIAQMAKLGSFGLF
jgi:hypothetical protein